MKKTNLIYLREKIFFIAILLLIVPSLLLAQNPKMISGVVKDSKGNPLSGASIVVKGTSNGTATGADGKFSLTVPNEKSVLLVSFAGYQSQDISVKNLSSFTISLSEENKNLSEVVVTGYTKQSKRDVTGAVSTISADIVAQTPASDIGTILQGRAAGVSVDDQGDPGSNAVVRIRGFGTNG